MPHQWFIRLLDHRDDLKQRGRQLGWHPEWMRQPLDDWIDGLRYDWEFPASATTASPSPSGSAPVATTPSSPSPHQLPQSSRDKPLRTGEHRQPGGARPGPEVEEPRHPEPGGGRRHRGL
jgi:hypothetical protein